MVIFWCYLIVSSRKLDGIKQSIAHFNHKKILYKMIYKTCIFYTKLEKKSCKPSKFHYYIIVRSPIFFLMNFKTTIFGHPTEEVGKK
ncbi:hypothetical protein BpHYR1_042231 [Brachionus plicatilis]|uniref:Uncharacterized protein n=1 Tax=Brachionus plicatilis TaxID=10195 RepID=A0A3M7PES0_BRAPC|nr:hypothetical protein BpHYR1_042231 [Brachionus plicatilis]